MRDGRRYISRGVKWGYIMTCKIGRLRQEPFALAGLCCELLPAAVDLLDGQLTSIDGS